MKKIGKYDHRKIEKKLQKMWSREGIYRTKETKNKNKYYILDMFPYPSGDGLHVGHPKGYIATDIMSRQKRMQGLNVLHPMGFDAFGLPAENYALKTKTNPEIAVKRNVLRYKKQLEILGLDYDWSREINTTDPEYYKWTQWIFLQLFKKGLAHESYEPINWCPSCKTGLANEDIEDGKCERCGSIVEKKPMRQWVLKITDYADRLLNDLDARDKNGKPVLDWPEHIKESQRNWIGRSEGALIRFKLKTQDSKTEDQKEIDVFTTRPDTIFGVTYLVLAPEHSLVQELLTHTSNSKDIVSYIDLAKNKNQIERTDEKKEKSGVELKGVLAVNPANGEEIPVWIADYVLADYGTGAVMAVPAHDVRDWEFAKKYNLKIKQVIAPYFENTTDLIPRKEKLTKTRNNIHAIIRNPKNNTYLVQKWKEHGWQSFITGGIENSENIIDAARREVLEETGYKNIKYIQNLHEDWQVHSYFFAKHKDENRYMRAQAVFFDLIDEDKQDVHEEDKGKYTLEWINEDKVRDYLSYDNQKVIWDFFNKPSAFINDGALVNSGSFDGKSSESVMKDITSFVGGKWVTKYKLRDWVFSRQRYWGEPIPVVHCPKCGVVPVPEKDLPVKLPKVKSYEPTGTGESPLAAIDKWVNVKCPKCIEEKNKTKYLIFDFDGVLGDTWEVQLQAKVDMGDAKDKSTAARTSIEWFSGLSDHIRDIPRTAEEIKRRDNWSSTYGELISKSDFSLFKGFITELKKIKNAKFAVVSSGSSKYVVPALKKSGIKFTHILSFENHHSKEEKVEKICRDWKIDVNEAYYFTDTNQDVYELSKIMNKKRLIGCSWGYLGADILKKALPESQILNRFKEVHKLFDSVHMAKRETNTMPQWAGSSWYYLRFMDTQNRKQLVDSDKEKYWAPVDMYVGGAEHATRHLIYARFWHKFLYDIGVVSTVEPFYKLQPVGLIMGEDGRKMSKRFGNVINPDQIANQFGADTLRIYEMFMGPFDQQISWSTDSIVGCRRFIEKVWRLQEKVITAKSKSKNSHVDDDSVIRLINRTIKKVGEDILEMRFNTAISALMIAVNEIEKKDNISKDNFEKIIKLLAPFAPHMTDVIWRSMGNKKSIHVSTWPEYDASKIDNEDVVIVVQVNGKVRGNFTTNKSTSSSELENMAKNMPELKKWISGKEIIKVIVIPAKLVNIVIKDI
jgi:leucyl-tRNA synthetase/FMN phosphatase YigB (HAD superfamily)